MDALIEMKDFYQEIAKYDALIKDYLNEPFHTDTLIKAIKNSRAELQRSYSRLENTILEYGGRTPITHPLYGESHDVFDIAFRPVDYLNCDENIDALNKVMAIVNKTIGKLEAEGASWNRPTRYIRSKSQKPKAFISHSGNTPALTELRDYLEELGIDKLVVVKKPNLDREINVKVQDYLDEADFVVILATGDSRDRNNKVIPAGNVIHETGLAQAKPKFKGKIIYLLEDGVEFPSNIKPKSYIRFNCNNINYKFGEITKEIKAMGFLI
jgi:predicted nucleotide-binding protein